MVMASLPSSLTLERVWLFWQAVVDAGEFIGGEAEALEVFAAFVDSAADAVLGGGASEEVGLFFDPVADVFVK